MLRRHLIFASGLVGVSAIGQQQPDPFRQVDYAEILPAHGLTADFEAMTSGSQIYVPPLFRYRLTLKTDGAIRELLEPRAKAVARWSGTFGRPDFAQLFTHEVSAFSGEKSFWLPWQSALVQPFRDELSAGGLLSVKVLFAGAIPNEVLLLSIGYEKLLQLG